MRDTVNGQAKYVAVGVVSYGDGCAKPLTPGYFLFWSNINTFLSDKIAN